MQHKKSSTIESEISCFLAFASLPDGFWQTFHDFRKTIKELHDQVKNPLCLTKSSVCTRTRRSTRQQTPFRWIPNPKSVQQSKECVFETSMLTSSGFFWVELRGCTLWQSWINSTRVLGISGKARLNNSVVFTLINLRLWVVRQTLGHAGLHLGRTIRWLRI